MVKSLFSICLLIASALAWSGVPDEGHREAGYIASAAIMLDAGPVWDVDDAAKLMQFEEIRSIATVAHAEHVGQGYQGAATARVIGSGSSGMRRIGVSTTASNPPDI